VCSSDLEDSVSIGKEKIIEALKSGDEKFNSLQVLDLSDFVVNDDTAMVVANGIKKQKELK